MRSWTRLLALVVWFSGGAVVAAGQANQARLMGTVLDDSGGALPGVTVTLRAGAAAPISVFTDGSGRYMTAPIAPGTYTITFELSGFESRTVSNVAVEPGKTVVLDQQLPLASLAETVEVTAAVPTPPEKRARPRPAARPVDKEILASVCGPRQAPDFSLAIGKVVSHRDSDRQLMGPGDVLRIDAGEKHGLVKDQNLVVRRRFQTGDPSVARKQATYGEQTAGLIQIIETQPASAVALVVYVCGEIFAGDVVERYVPQPAFFAITAGTPHFDDPARITLGEHNQTAGIGGQMMVIDRGIMQGVQRGQRLTIFRRSLDAGGPPHTIGDAVVVAVRADSATMRIERSIDAVMVGDLVAIHK
jgi:hypothetical protein